MAARELTRSARGVNTPNGSEIAPLLMGTRLATRMSAMSAARSAGRLAACCWNVSPVCASAAAPWAPQRERACQRSARWPAPHRAAEPCTYIPKQTPSSLRAQRHAHQYEAHHRLPARQRFGVEAEGVCVAAHHHHCLAPDISCQRVRGHGDGVAAQARSAAAPHSDGWSGFTSGRAAGMGTDAGRVTGTPAPSGCGAAGSSTPLLPGAPSGRWGSEPCPAG